MSDLTPQQEGRAWEPVFAASIGATPVKNSGAGFAKLDVRGAQILWSLKWAGRHESVRIQDAWMYEAIAAINGPGGIGGGAIPGIATKTQGFEMLTFRKHDALMLMTSDNINVATPQALGVIDLGRRTPAYLRGDA